LRPPLNELETAVTITQQAMAEASAAVLGGFKLRSEAKLFRYPDNYHDERGEQMWSIVWELLKKSEKVTRCGSLTTGVTVAHS